MKISIFAALTAFSLIAGGVVAQTPQAAPKQCFMVLGGPTQIQSSALMTRSPDSKTVHLYFLRGKMPLDKMSAGAKFAEVTPLMQDQGNQGVSVDSDRVLAFSNNSPGYPATYKVAINGGNLSGTYTNSHGNSFPIRGKCLDQ